MVCVFVMAVAPPTLVFFLYWNLESRGTSHVHQCLRISFDSQNNFCYFSDLAFYLKFIEGAVPFSSMAETLLAVSGRAVSLCLPGLLLLPRVCRSALLTSGS